MATASLGMDYYDSLNGGNGNKRTVMGQSFSQNKYNKINNTWGSYRGNYATQ